MIRNAFLLSVLLRPARALFATVLLAGCGTAANGQEPDVRYEPSPPEVVEAMLAIANVEPDDVMYDLGSGDGRIVIAAARDFGVRSAKGVDIDPERIQEARQNARKAGVADRVTFIQADLFTYDFSDADVVTLYLLPWLNIKLRPRLLDELAPGTRVVSHSHDMNDWAPDEHRRVRGKDIYLWIIPAQASGKWRLETEDRAYDLSLAQRFQDLSGTLTIGGRETRLRDAAVNGRHIEFTARPTRNGRETIIRFSGEISDGRFEGTLFRDGDAQPVTGRRMD